ncbi:MULTISPECIES: hypothetical protein [unclassified Sphingobium]|uniref:hypothetical protein n=1 Tax=unclassified Sphingobium TaxID=2611147 RepID=UPI00086C8366|nr:MULTISPECIES: hypothetical protein [unclassified Sphingobium]ODU69594.1 MAG: hypothetical protein ABT11_11340 [Novosphingobium sp. SCN 66-18]CAH0351826.1 hypothetical protein SPH9361_01632 [Sphingobium sp. CECT 9361]
MMHATVARGEAIPAPDELVTAAARCWRAARDARAPVQQRLYMTLSPHDCGMLAPVFASLMALCEAALGRPIAVGGVMLSDDEHLLIGLLDGSKPRRACIDCADGVASALDCAICSTRIMMALTMGRPTGYPNHQLDPTRIRLTIPS